MKENKSENQPAEESDKIPPPPATPVKPSPPPAKPAPEPKKANTRAGQFFRTLLIWLGVIAVAFLAGVGTYHFVRYAPTAKSLGETKSALDEANSELGTLRTEKQKADDKISALQNELDTANAHVDILQLLADTNGARLALIAKDIEGAKTALENSTETLNRVIPLLTKADASLAQSMSQRLVLILSGVERDPASAQIDLELLTKDILTAENILANR